MADCKDIWVFAERSGGNVAPVTLELLAKARDLKQKTGDKAVAVLLGCDTGDCARILLTHGADKVLRVEAAALKDYKPIPFAAALAGLVEKHRPSILLFGATAQGRDLAPRLQSRLLTGLTADCLDLDIDAQGLLVQTKPSYGDNIMCTITCPTARPQMATVRPRVFSPLAAQSETKGEIVDERADVADDPGYEVLDTASIAVQGEDICGAEVIVALGRGADSEGAIAAARDLAAALNGVIAVTRPLTDDGVFQHDCQIGQSGQTVKPKCILNFGISGAIQYTVGMQNADLIVSVDTNRDAPIFGFSHLGYVGDAEETIKAITAEVRSM